MRQLAGLLDNREMEWFLKSSKKMAQERVDSQIAVLISRDKKGERALKLLLFNRLHSFDGAT